jgi:hypothetical protein
MAEGETAGAPAGDADPAAEEPTGRYSAVLRAVKEGWHSESYLLRSYAVVGTLVAVLVAVAFLLALPGWIVASLSSTGTVTFSRAFLLLTGVLVVVPLVAPTVLAARRRRKRGSTRRRDALYALSGYGVVLGLYASLLVSAPPDLRDPPPAVVAPVVEFLYSLEPIYGVVPPVVAALGIVVVHRT